MKVKRTFTIKTEDYQIGDVIKIKLTNGEKYTATAVAYEGDGTLFLFDNLLSERKAATEIKEYLNTEFLQMLPNKLLAQMTLFDNTDYMVRVPTEKELFGINEYGEPEDVEQWEQMKDARRRVCNKKGSATSWYWTSIEYEKDATNFAGVDYNGFCFYYSASLALSVRPVIKLINRRNR